MISLCAAVYDPVSGSPVDCKNSVRSGKTHCDFHFKFVKSSCKRYKRQSFKVKRLMEEINFEISPIEQILSLRGNIEREREARIEHRRRYYNSEHLDEGHMQYIETLDKHIGRCDECLKKRYETKGTRVPETEEIRVSEPEEEEFTTPLETCQEVKETYDNEKKRKKRKRKRKEALLKQHLEMEREEIQKAYREFDEFCQHLCRKRGIEPLSKVKIWGNITREIKLGQRRQKRNIGFEERELQYFQLVEQTILYLTSTFTTSSFIQTMCNPSPMTDIGQISPKSIRDVLFAKDLFSECEVLQDMCFLICKKMETPIVLTLLNFCKINKKIFLIATTRETTDIVLDRMEFFREIEVKYVDSEKLFRKLFEKMELINENIVLCELIVNKKISSLLRREV